MVISGTARSRLLASTMLLAVPAFGSASEENRRADRPIEEIVITAQKRQTNLYETPGSISALTSEDIALRNIDSVEEISHLAPSVNFSQFQSYAQVTVRGIGTDIASAYAEPGVALHVDGVYRGGLISSASLLFDVERIEILRGPQGTLYGRNATGGNINVISNTPGDTFSADISQAVGNFGMARTEASLDAPVSDRASVRVAVLYEDRDNYRDNRVANAELNDNETRAGRAALRLEPNDALEVVLTADWIDMDLGGPVWQLTEYNPLGPNFLSPANPGGALALPGSCGPVSCETAFNLQFPTPAGPPLTDTEDVRHDTVSKFTGEQKSLSANISYDIGDVTVRSVTGYFDSDRDDLLDNDATELDFLVQGLDAEYDEISQEINISNANSDSRLQWIAGLYYYEQQYESLSTFAFPAIQRFVEAGAGLATIGQPFPPGVLATLGPRADGSASAIPFVDWRFDQDTESTAVFGQTTFGLTDRLSATIGLRRTWDEKSARQSVFSNGLSPVTCTDLEQDEDWSRTTGTAGLDMRINEGTLVYATFSKGYKSGGFNNATCGNQFDPEDIDAYEVGIKSSLAEDRVQLNAAVFQSDYDDYQGKVFINNSTVIQNAAAADIWGVELEWLAVLGNSWRLFGNASYLDSEFQEYLGLNPLGAPGVLEDFSGNSLPRSPEWQINAGLEYTYALPNGSDLIFVLDYSYTDEQNFSDADLPQSFQDSYSITDARIVWHHYRDSGARVSIQGFVTNLTDEEYANALVPTGIIGNTVANYGPPRAYGIVLSYER